MHRVSLIFVLTMALLFVACGDPDQMASAQARQVSQAPLDLASLGYLGDQGGIEPAQGNLVHAQKLIRNGQISFNVSSASETIETVRLITSKYSGRLSDSQIETSGGGSRNATLTLRIPAAEFDSVMDELRAIEDLQRESISTQDVGKQYADLETRLSVLDQTEARLRGLLDSRAASLSEILELEREIGRVVEQRERLEGERRYLDSQIAVSTILIQLFERGSASSPGLGTGIGEAIREALQTFERSIVFVVYVMTFVIPWLIIVTTIWLIVRWFRRKV